MKTVAATVAALVALAVTESPALADPTIVGQWHFDEGTGSVVHDTSGSGNDGNIVRDVGWVPGRFGSALSFNGATSRVLVNDNTALEPATSVSVSAWFKHLGSPGDYRYIMAKGASDCITASYGLYSGPDGGLMFYVGANHGTSYSRSPDAGPGVWDGKWHVAVGTFDGSYVRLYVDGREIGSGTSHPGSIEYLLRDSNDLFIGDYPGCVPHNFDGEIDELTIWNGALSPTAVAAAYTSATGQSTGASGGQTGTQGAQTGGSGTPPSQTPAISHLSVSPSSFALDVVHARRATRQTTGATVSYVDNLAAMSSFTVLARKPGFKRHGTCAASPPQRGAKPAARCFYYTRIGTFTHADRAGRNSFRFMGLRRHRLAVGKYRLDATPRAQGLTGRTISVAFTVVR
jgi:Concanavalin A-like lectin/glucanases superfamily